MMDYNSDHQQMDDISKTKEPAEKSFPNHESKAAEAQAESEVEERDTWGSKIDFLLSTIGCIIGLGNVWRFPYICYKNGGGAFLIPYIFFLVLVGLPLVFLEMSIGQFSNRGCITVWQLCPLFKGLGYCMMLLSGLVAITYNVVIMYTLFYMFASFTSHLPWATCNNPWNTPACSTGLNETVCNITLGVTENCTNVTYPRKYASEEYWENYVLEISSGLEDVGQIRWQLTLCLLLAWIIVFLCLIKGIKSSGKVVYFTAVFPFVVLFALLIRGVTLPGAREGILYYVTPRLEELKKSGVWADAASQVFYSLAPAWGVLITMASYNKFNNNIYRDALIISITNSVTSIFAGFAIFSFIGFMAHELKSDPGTVIAGGPGLAFVAYPTGVSMMPLAPFWSILFFFMLFTLGLDSQFGMIEVVMGALIDEWPALQKKRIWVLVTICIVDFLLGMPIVTQGGQYITQLFDTYIAGFPVLITGFLEVAVVSWIYGYNRLCDDIAQMVGGRPNYFWIACWVVVTPLLIITTLVFAAVSYKPLTYGKYVFPPWANQVGWGIVALPLSAIPIYMVIQYCKASNPRETFKKVLSPAPDWGATANKWKPTDAKDAETAGYDNTTFYSGTHM